MSYEYVEDKQFLKRARKDCSETMQELVSVLREEYDISSQFFLVGSGKRNMITRNAGNPIDFDYNLNIVLSPEWNERWLKEAVRKSFNKVMKAEGLDDVEDSTSSLTTKCMWFKDRPDIRFSMDVCIVTETDEGWQRLIHEKHGYVAYDRYYWNMVPDSSDIREKAKEIKSVPGLWEDVRDLYLELKNKALRSQLQVPSFVSYIEAVNNVHHNYFD